MFSFFAYMPPYTGKPGSALFEDTCQEVERHGAGLEIARGDTEVRFLAPRYTLLTL